MDIQTKDIESFRFLIEQFKEDLEDLADLDAIPDWLQSLISDA